MYELKGENFLKWNSSKQKWHDFWGELWTKNDTKWDQNGPHPAIVESYKELSEIALLGNNMSHLLNDAIKNYTNHCKKLIELREKKLSQFSPENNKKNWQQFWNNILIT